MDFQLTDEQKLLRESVRTFTKQRSPVTRFRKLRDAGGGWEPEVWKAMGELGWLSLPMPESLGGFGGSMVDVAIVLEAFGTTLVPEPYIPSIVLAGSALLDAGSPEQHARWLQPTLDGGGSLALAYAERGHRFAALPHETQAVRTPEGVRLTGRKEFVQHGQHADAIVVSARYEGAPSLFVVERGMPGVTITPVRTLDGLGAATVELDATLPESHRLVGGDAAAAMERALDAAATAAVAEGLGLCVAVLEMTRQHLRTREQFGVPIGTFQALQHRAVDMFVEVELVRSVAMLAAIRMSSDDVAERQKAVSAAKAQFAVSGRFVTQQAIQLHGGIGITDEHDIGLYLKRVHALGLLYGDEEHHVRRFAALPGFAAA